MTIQTRRRPADHGTTSERLGLTAVKLRLRHPMATAQAGFLPPVRDRMRGPCNCVRGHGGDSVKVVMGMQNPPMRKLALRGKGQNHCKACGVLELADVEVLSW
jgi:hypothetical protein